MRDQVAHGPDEVVSDSDIEEGHDLSELIPDAPPPPEKK